MRSLSKKEGVFFFPLDTILGTPAAVRVLRVLHTFGGPCSLSTIAQRGRISKNAAWVTVRRLSDMGVLRSVGQGSVLSYEVDERHPFAGAVAELFATERRRVDAVLIAVNKAAAGMSPPPHAVWLYGSVARREDDALSDMDIAVVTDDVHASAAAETLRRALEPIAERWRVTPSVIALTPERIARVRQSDPAFIEALLTDGTPLYGAAPTQLLSAGAKVTP